jgi:hypothetical protein
LRRARGRVLGGKAYTPAAAHAPDLIALEPSYFAHDVYRAASQLSAGRDSFDSSPTRRPHTQLVRIAPQYVGRILVPPYAASGVKLGWEPVAPVHRLPHQRGYSTDIASLTVWIQSTQQARPPRSSVVKAAPGVWRGPVASLPQETERGRQPACRRSIRTTSCAAPRLLPPSRPSPLPLPEQPASRLRLNPPPPTPRYAPCCDGHRRPTRVGKALWKPPRRKQTDARLGWVLMCLQGGRGHALTGCAVATLCCPNPARVRGCRRTPRLASSASSSMGCSVVAAR